MVDFESSSTNKRRQAFPTVEDVGGKMDGGFRFLIAEETTHSVFRFPRSRRQDGWWIPIPHRCPNDAERTKCSREIEKKKKIHLDELSIGEDI